MLRMLPITSAQGLKDYFTQALGRGDYYMQGQEIVGQWLGKGAALLNLRGEVEHEPFFDLCDNLDPRTGKTLTARQRDNRKVGYEVTVSCPKSISLAYARATGQQKQDILEAFRLSLTDTATEMESAMQTQVGQGGKQPPRTTGNMLGAGFIHTEARETEGHAPDPDLHGHLIFFNATYDRREQRWKAGEFHDIKQEAPYYQAFFGDVPNLLIREGKAVIVP
jgi:conjugative relaxase-like TrwC/TraI family protein